jgi:hypothetical protein
MSEREDGRARDGETERKGGAVKGEGIVGEDGTEENSL